MSVLHWLESLHLEQYLHPLLQGGFNTLDKCAVLSEETLTGLGVALPGHRKRILSHLPDMDTLQEMIYDNIPVKFSPKNSCSMESPADRTSGGSSLDGATAIRPGSDEYDYLPSTRPISSTTEEEGSDDEVYENIQNIKKPNGETPPSLPPKQVVGMDSLEKLGVKKAHMSGSKWKPVPTPRQSKMKKPLSSDVDVEEQEKPKPTPPPRHHRRSMTSRESTEGDDIAKQSRRIESLDLSARNIESESISKMSIEPVVEEPKEIEMDINDNKAKDLEDDLLSRKLEIPLIDLGGAAHKSDDSKDDKDEAKKLEDESKQNEKTESTEVENAVVGDSFSIDSFDPIVADAKDDKLKLNTSLVPDKPPVTGTGMDLDDPMFGLISKSEHTPSKSTGFISPPTQTAPPITPPSVTLPAQTITLEDFDIFGQESSTDGESETPNLTFASSELAENFLNMSKEKAMEEKNASPKSSANPDGRKLPFLAQSSVASSSSMSPEFGPSLTSPAYQAMWNMSTGMVPTGMVPEVTTEEENMYDEALPVRTSYKEGEEERSCKPPSYPPAMPSRVAQLMQKPQGRDSITSFHEPPPDFSPPQLPSSLTDTDLSGFNFNSYVPPHVDPPALPPRPKNYQSPGENDKKPALKTPDNRDSTISFSELAVSRVLSIPEEMAPLPPRYPPPPDSPPPKLTPASAATPGRAAPSPPMHSHPALLTRDAAIASENQYSGEPISPPPKPPPRGPNPFANLFNAKRGTYDFGDGDFVAGASCFVGLESDDTLSDGGDFFDSLNHQRPSVLESSIPIVPAAPTATTDRTGFLFKHASTHSQRRGWKKYYVTFDGNQLKYFSNKDSKVSKRLIPAITMMNVEQDIKSNEAHPYRFKITTVDRVYSFATDDVDNLTLWTSCLMRSILDCQQISCFIEGGEMYHPDKQGFMKMEGVKNKRFLTVKGDRFCYYNTYNDYKGGCPIHQIDMKLASVKDLGRLRLQLITHYTSYIFLCESGEELTMWKEALEEAIAEGLADDSKLQEVYENHSNRLCADCGAPDPHWASINMVMTLCKRCAGVHRMLTNPQSKVRSLRMDLRVWTPSLIKLLQEVGNDNANNFWEWHTSEEDRIDSDVDMDVRKEYILAKYSEGRFCRLHPLHSDLAGLNEALCKSVQYGDVLETMHLAFSGADLLCKTSAYGGQDETPVQLAKKAKQTLQMEFLYQNGASDAGLSRGVTIIRDNSLSSAARALHFVNMKGYLLKAGPNNKEFHKRWCVLEHGTFTYFESEKSVICKDFIERKDMISIGTWADDKYEFGFELGTTKMGGRVYMFAAENSDDQHLWLIKLAKNFAPIHLESIDQIRDLDRAGVVFLRDGATTDWHMTWIQLRGKCLAIYKKDEKKFEEIDLRKATGIKSLQKSETCLEAFDEGPPFVIDLRNRALYIQGDLRSETEKWLATLQKASTESGGFLIDQQLTADEVPVIVDKCISFIATFGLKTEGIYRHSGQHSKVTKLLQEFSNNANNVHLTQENFQVHDVANVLKRYFRTLQEPILTTILYSKWIDSTNLTDIQSKMQWYMYLLGELPKVHYNTIKKLMGHLARVSEYDKENKMTAVNLASVYGPILMTVDTGESLREGYKSTNQEISVALDLLTMHQKLFEVKDEELEREQKIQEALEKIQRANEHHSGSAQPAGDLLLGVYLNSQEGDCITLKVPANMTGEDMLTYVVGKSQLDATKNWGLYEVICQGQLERPLHYQECVLDVTLRWAEWPEDFRVNNYLCVKDNYVLENVENVFDPQFSLFTELKFSEKKGFKKFCFEFNQYKLSYHKDTKSLMAVQSWNVEDLIIYIGTETRRSPPSRLGLTFITETEKVAKTRDSPYFGHSMCFNNKQELYRWMAAMLHAQHPDGLSAKGASSHITNLPDKPAPPPPQQFDMLSGASEGRHSPSFMPARAKSLFNRFKKK